VQIFCYEIIAVFLMRALWPSSACANVVFILSFVGSVVSPLPTRQCVPGKRRWWLMCFIMAGVPLRDCKFVFERTTPMTLIFRSLAGHVFLDDLGLIYACWKKEA